MSKKTFDTRFAKAELAKPNRSKFNRSSTNKTTFDANMLIPIFVDEVIPGDTFNMSQTSFCRLATPIKPSMDNLYLDTHYFFVPSRLLWDNWERFMGAQDNPGDSTDYLIPTVNAVFADEAEYTESIFDQFGIPRVESGELHVSALPLRAYNLIFNEWYRDQNLQDSVVVEKGDSDSLSNYELLRRGKRHDYFTSALPWPQKGEPVGLSLSGDAVVDISGNGVPRFDAGSGSQPLQTVNGSGFISVNINGTADQTLDWTDPALLGVANLDTVTAVTINELRQAFQLQKFLERDARSGTRYIEVIKSHFGVTNPDFRLQRPEFLGGAHENLHFTTIAQTSQAFENTTPQGNLSAMGTVGGQKHCFNRSFTEHGFVIGIASVYADLTYQQGLNRMWSRQTRVDHFWPVFAHLSEQEIFNKEIFASGDAAQDTTLFGYQERYAEYRYLPNRISGKFRSSYSNSLDVWHYSEEFESLPLLNGSFVENNAPVKRNSAVLTEPDFIADFYFGLQCVRPIPMYGTPGFIDHF